MPTTGESLPPFLVLAVGIALIMIAVEQVVRRLDAPKHVQRLREKQERAKKRPWASFFNRTLA